MRGKANHARNGERLTFRWHQWAFVLEDDLPSDTRAEMAEIIAANGGNAAFMRCLSERNRQRRQVSEKPTAQNYAPKQFAKMPEAKGFNVRELEAAMDRLFRTGVIERRFLYRDTGEGTDVYGLRETSGNLTGNLPETPSEDLRKPAENDRIHPPLYTTFISGAGPGGPPPLDREGEKGCPRCADEGCPWCEREAAE